MAISSIVVILHLTPLHSSRLSTSYPTKLLLSFHAAILTDANRRVDCSLQHLWQAQLVSVRDSCCFHCHQDSYTGDRAWRHEHILRTRMEYAVKIWLQLGAARLKGERFIELALLLRFLHWVQGLETTHCRKNRGSNGAGG